MKNTAKIKFTDDSGNSISREELAKSTGRFNYEIFGVENVSSLAKTLHNQARHYGQTGAYQKAIEILLQANKEAPKWPYPVYDLAFTYLLQGDWDNALKYYIMTDSLAPRGFFTSKTALHTLERERKGELKAGLYNMYVSLEWINDPQERFENIKLIVVNFPSFAPGWKEYSNLLEGKDRISAIEKGLELDADMDTRGLLLINKALMLDHHIGVKWL